MAVLHSRRLAGPAIRTFENIADRWELRPAERRRLLGDMPPTTYARIRKRPDAAELSSDTLERISHVLGIYKALHVLFPSAQYADRWIAEPNTAFGGTPAKQKMLEGFTQLVDVRRYLDAQRGW
ncbi:MAG: antitoxin Xre-like helix-turn-helix domain-containing protein [Candidatus Elarobacter sp.]